MRLLFDQCNDHDYIFINSQSVPVAPDYDQIVSKEIYACIHCGVEMGIYDLDEPVFIGKETDA